MVTPFLVLFRDKASGSGNAAPALGYLIVSVQKRISMVATCARAALFLGFKVLPSQPFKMPFSLAIRITCEYEKSKSYIAHSYSKAISLFQATTDYSFCCI